MVVIIGPVEEKNVPDAATDNAGETTIHSKVKNMDVPAPAIPLGQIIRRDAG